MELPKLEAMVEEARREGARGVEVLWEQVTGHTARADGRKVVQAPLDVEDRLRITVWLEGGRRGEATALDGDGTACLRSALAAAAGAPEQEDSGPVDRLRPVVAGLGIRDRRYDHLEPEDREELLTDALRGARSVDRAARLEQLRYRDEHRQRRFVNSRGVALEEASTRFDAWGEVHLGGLRLDDHIASRSFASIGSLPFGHTLAQRAKDLLVDGETLDGEVKAMLPPRVVAQLIEALGPAFTPDRVGGLTPFFLYAPEGEPAPVDERLHLLDDGQLPGGLHTRSFDDRGVVPVPRTFVREGRADQAMVPPDVARRGRTTPTGHVAGHGLRTGNLGLRGGTRSMNASYTDADTWALELDSLDLSGLDWATGVCETHIDAKVMQSNVQRGAVRDRRARLDLKRMLSNIVRLCSDTDRIRHIDAPALFLDGLVLL